MRTTPVPGSDPTPGSGGLAEAPDDRDPVPPLAPGASPNEERLRRDKPPHY